MLVWCTGSMGEYGWPKQLIHWTKLGNVEGRVQKYEGCMVLWSTETKSILHLLIVSREKLWKWEKSKKKESKYCSMDVCYHFTTIDFDAGLSVLVH